MVLTKKNISKFFFLILFLNIIPYHGFSQYLGIRYLDKESYEEKYFYKIYALNGNQILELKKNETPYFSSFMIKKYDFETEDWSIKINDRWPTNILTFFLTEKNQQILPITTPDSTYVIDFKGNLIESFGKKYQFLSQPKDGNFLGYRKIENQAAYMLSYLNEKGEELFNGKEFWEATTFSESHAIVQEENENGVWKIINITGAEVLNLSNKFNRKIVKAYPFVNGYANLVVSKNHDEVIAINKRIHENRDSILHYFSLSPNAEEYENKVGYDSYRIGLNGEIQKLPWNLSIQDDIYYRTFYKSTDYAKIIAKPYKTNTFTLVDSLLSPNGKYYIIKDKSEKHQLMNHNGVILEFPDRYKPIKCIENLVLGKRRNNYVLFDPDSKNSLYFKDSTPLHNSLVLEKEYENSINVEEFIIVGNKILKFGLYELSSILTLEGNLVHDFYDSTLDSTLETKMLEMYLVFECPQTADYEEIQQNQMEYLNIKCAEFDFQPLLSITNIKMIGITGLDKAINSKHIAELLNKKIDVFIEGTIDAGDLDIDLKESYKGKLYINDIEIIPNDQNKK